MYFLDYSSPPLTSNSLTAIMDLCFQESDYFSLTYHSYPLKTNELITELFPYRHRRIHTARWFNHIRKEDNAFEIFLYPANQNTEAILKKHYTGLFLDNVYDKTLKWKQSLEDLCFFLKGKLILGTVSHEIICKVYPPNENYIARLMDSCSYWQFADDDGEQINLSDYTKL